MADQTMAEKNAAALQVAYGKLIAKAWSDQAFKRRLLSDPAAVLKDEGFDVPAGVTVRVFENTDKVVNLILPPPPKEGELSDEDLERVAGGGKYTDLCVTVRMSDKPTLGTVGPPGCR